MSTKRSRRGLFSRAGTASRRQSSFSHFRYCGAQFVRKMMLQGVSNCALDDIRAVIRAARLQAANSYRTEACFLWNFVLQLDACSLKFCSSFFLNHIPKRSTEPKSPFEPAPCTHPTILARLVQLQGLGGLPQRVLCFRISSAIEVQV